MFADLLSIAGLTVLIMISPGADLALVTRNTVVGGKTAGGWTSAGILTGNLVHLSYSLLGLGLVIAASGTAFAVLKWVGGAYLMYLGVQSLRQASSEPEELAEAIDPSPRWWVQGLLNNLLNPKGPLFYLGVLAAFVSADSSVVYLMLLAATTLSVSTAFWVLFVYVLQISAVRQRLLLGGRWVNRVLGVVLMALGAGLWLSEGPEPS